jgi:hypothetical protein
MLFCRISSERSPASAGIPSAPGYRFPSGGAQPADGARAACNASAPNITSLTNSSGGRGSAPRASRYCDGSTAINITCGRRDQAGLACQWQLAPRCQRISCGNFSAPPNARVVDPVWHPGRRYVSGEQIQLRCNAGFASPQVRVFAEPPYARALPCSALQCAELP